MALAVDGSSPAAVVGSTATTTTAAFSPPANSLLVAYCEGDANNGNAGEQLTVTSTGGLSWSLAGRANGSPGATVESWQAKADSAPGSITVSVTDNQGAVAKRIQVEVFTDAGNGTPAGIGATNTSAATSVSYTSTVAGSLGTAVGLGGGGSPVAGSGQTLVDSDTAFDGGDGCWVIKQNSTTANPGTSVTMSVTAPTTVVHHLAVEVLPAPVSAASATTPNAFHPGRGPSRFARFFQPARDTTQFSTSLADTGSAADAITVADITVGARQPDGRHPGKGPTTARFYQPPRDYTVAGTVQVTLTETGSADDSVLSVSATVPVADAGSAGDALTVSATVPLSDTGTATDDSGVVTATVPLADTATAADALTVTDVTVGARSPDGRHPGRGPTSARFYQPRRPTDLVTATSVALTDSAAASDALTVSATVPLTDTASAADDLAISVQLAVTDAASALDVLGLSAAVPVADTGSAADSLTVVDVTVGARRPTSLHPGRGPTNARFFQPPRSTAIQVAHSCTTPRPSTGTTTRPTSGTTAYATATTARPSTGTTARPDTGITQDPC